MITAKVKILAYRFFRILSPIVFIAFAGNRMLIVILTTMVKVEQSTLYRCTTPPSRPMASKPFAPQYLNCQLEIREE